LSLNKSSLTAIGPSHLEDSANSDSDLLGPCTIPKIILHIPIGQ
jgi:hypothetical protein